ncbi:MAG: beta-lactamase family protein [Acetatifactor sp.]|nr:beta-lactamase family protein [Acetatifactor sp.]
MNIQQKLSDYIHTELDYWDFSGAVRITQKGKTLLETYRGYSSREFGIENDKNTRFSVASVTKQFTGFAIMLLYDRGLLLPDERANRYLPPSLHLPTDITVHQLLSHTSGLHNNYNFEDDFYVGEDRKPYDQKAFFHNWIIREPLGRPGEAFDYNNSNYTLLAWIIENVSGQSYNEFLTANIFSRLGMDNTLYDNGLDIIPNKADNYLHDYGALVRAPYTNSLFGLGAGGLVTNCNDLQKWYECLRNRKLLSSHAYELYFTENRNHYCYGLERYTENGSVKYAHGGDILGVSAYTQYYFDEDICILILSNTESLDQYRLGNALAAILHGEPPLHSRRMEEISLSPEELEKYTGTYLPGKIQIEQRDGKLYLVRINQNIHIELYCVGRHRFKRRFEEQEYVHTLLSEDAAEPSVWGYKRVSTEI